MCGCSAAIPIQSLVYNKFAHCFTSEALGSRMTHSFSLCVVVVLLYLYSHWCITNLHTAQGSPLIGEREGGGVCVGGGGGGGGEKFVLWAL